MNDMTWVWVSFNLFVLAMLALDLGVFHRIISVVASLLRPKPLQTTPSSLDNPPGPDTH